MDAVFTDSYDKDFLLGTMMGPNAMRVTEEMTSFLPIKDGMRILDLGCGMGLSSIILAKKYNATVIAADLWISPTDNYKRFESLGLADRIMPVSVDATKGLPFAAGYFDMIVSVDAYHYFGADEAMLPSLVSLVKTGGYIAVAVPGLKRDLHNGEVPRELQPYLLPDMNFYSLSWWTELWGRADGLRLQHCREMDCLRRAWAEWLESPNPYAQRDIHMMEAEAGKYFSLVQLIGQKV